MSDELSARSGMTPNDLVRAAQEAARAEPTVKLEDAVRASQEPVEPEPEPQVVDAPAEPSYSLDEARKVMELEQRAGAYAHVLKELDLDYSDPDVQTLLDQPYLSAEEFLQNFATLLRKKQKSLAPQPASVVSPPGGQPAVGGVSEEALLNKLDALSPSDPAWIQAKAELDRRFPPSASGRRVIR